MHGIKIDSEKSIKKAASREKWDFCWCKLIYDPLSFLSLAVSLIIWVLKFIHQSSLRHVYEGKVLKWFYNFPSSSLSPVCDVFEAIYLCQQRLMVVNASSLKNSSYISKNLKLIDLKYISKQLHLMLACLTLSLIHKMQINLHLLSWKLKNLLPKREIIKEGKERLINSLSLHNNNRNHSRNSALSKYSENKIDGIFVATWRLARGINEYKTPFAWCHRDKYHMSMGAFIWQIQKHTSINLLSKVALQQQKTKRLEKKNDFTIH